MGPQHPVPAAGTAARARVLHHALRRCGQGLGERVEEPGPTPGRCRGSRAPHLGQAMQVLGRGSTCSPAPRPELNAGPAFRQGHPSGPRVSCCPGLRASQNQHACLAPVCRPPPPSASATLGLPPPSASALLLTWLFLDARPRVPEAGFLPSHASRPLPPPLEVLPVTRWRTSRLPGTSPSP